MTDITSSLKSKQEDYDASKYVIVEARVALGASCPMRHSLRARYGGPGCSRRLAPSPWPPAT
jgi:hypothetical protein